MVKVSLLRCARELNDRIIRCLTLFLTLSFTHDDPSFVLLVIGVLIAFMLGSALKTLAEINRRMKSTTDRLDELSAELGPFFKGGQELIDDILSSKRAAEQVQDK